MNKVFKRILSLTLALMMIVSLMPSFGVTADAASITGTISDENIGLSVNSVTSDSGKWNVADDVITVSLTSQKFGSSFKTKASSLTITNNGSVNAVLGFDYTITNNGTVTVDAGNLTTTQYSGSLEAGASVVVTFTSSKSSGSACNLTIKNMKLSTVSEVTTTFLPAENGTYTVDGAEVTAEISKTQLSSVNYVLKATAAEGYQFFGWYSNSKSSYVSYDAEAELAFTEDPRLTAHFISDEAVLFGVGILKYQNLNDAIAKAESGSDKTIVLLNGGTLSGSYTIPEGITLLIPFDDANTCYKATPGTVGKVNGSTGVPNEWETPYPYRTLTLAADASITVEGAISLSAKHSPGNGSGMLTAGSPSGAYGHIQMMNGSKITVAEGGALYAWGYITGAGSVLAQSGSEIHENFQFTDFRGGSASLSMATSGMKVFPLSQYYVQNIEVPTTFEDGSKEFVFTSIYAANDINSAGVMFIGNPQEDGSMGMFDPGEGSSITKTYDGSTDRLILDVNGDAKINTLSVSLGGNSINSSDFVLPINNNISINIHSGTTTVGQDMGLLPGSSLTIDQGAELKLTYSEIGVDENDDNEPDYYIYGHNLFVYDRDEWFTGIDFETMEEVTGKFVHTDVRLRPLAYAPSRTYTRTENDLKDVVLDINGTLTADGFVYTTMGGANIISSKETGKLVMVHGAGQEFYTAQANYVGGNTLVQYLALFCWSAQLQNGDGSYTYTGPTMFDEEIAPADPGDIFAYNASADKWEKLIGTVKFNANGGTGTMADQVVFGSGANIILPENGFTKVGFTFAGWNTAADGSGVAYAADDEFVVSGDVTLYAQWVETVMYTITWKIGDQTWTTDAEAGSALTEPNVTVPENYSGYRWTTTIPDSASEDTTIEGVWTAQLTVLDPDGNPVSVIGGNYAGVYDVGTGVYVNYGANYYEEGHDFYLVDTATGTKYALTYGAGAMPQWPTITLDKNVTLQGTFVPKEYTITFENEDGTELQSGKVAYGKTPVYNGETPTKAPTAEYSYEFSGWTPDITAVTGEATYTAVFNAIPNEYTLTWIIDGVTSTKTVAYGAEINAPAGLTKDGYTFNGWDGTIPATMPAENITITLTSTWTANKYTVTYDGNGCGFYISTDGNTLEQYVVNTAYGETHAMIPHGSEVYNLEWRGYNIVFAGWNTKADGTGTAYAPGDEIEITGDVTLYAQYAKIAVGNVTLNDGEYVDNDGYVTSTKPTGGYAYYNDGVLTLHNYSYTGLGYPYQYRDQCNASIYSGLDALTIVLEGENTIGNTFSNEGIGISGWGALTIRGDGSLNVTGTYAGIKGAITIESGSIVAEGMYGIFSYGKIIINGGSVHVTKGIINAEKGIAIAETLMIKTPVGGRIRDDGRYIVDSKGITAQEVLIAPRTYYTIGWDVDGDGNADVADSVEEGLTPSYSGETPTKAATAEYSYEFSGWTPAIVPATERATYTATFNAVPVEYTLTWIIDGVTTTETVAYGTEINAPADPTKEGHTFDGWDNEIPATMPAKDVTITALWNINQYTITFDTVGGTEIGAITQDYGTAVNAPADPAKTGYTFGGWDNEIPATMPAEDITITAQWMANEYTVNWFSNGGAFKLGGVEVNSVGTKTAYGSVIEFKQFNLPVREGYEFTGWNTKADGSGEDLSAESVMNTTDNLVAYYAQWKVKEYTYTVNTYTMGVDGKYGDPVAETKTAAYGTELYVAPTAIAEGFYLDGENSDLAGTVPANNDLVLSVYIARHSYKLTFWVSIMPDYYEDGTLAWQQNTVEVPYGTNLADLIPETVSYTVDGTEYKGIWEFDMWTTDDSCLTEAEIPESMPAKDLEFFQKHLFTGWAIDEYGTVYAIKNEIAYHNTIAHIDGDAYLFDVNGYIVAGAGLYRHVTEDGTVEYYYFCDGHCEDRHVECEFGVSSYTAFKNGIHWIYNNLDENGNELLPNWDYEFDDRGVIKHNENTGLNGLVDEGEDTIYYIDGVPAYMGLIKVGNDYYYVRSSGKLIKSATYWISKTNDLLKEKAYEFDADGKLVVESINEKNGIHEEDGKLYYYVEGVRTYAGLIQIDGEYYYIKTNCEAVRGGIFWITKTNGIMKPGNYNFDETGKMIPMPEEEKFTGIKDGYYYQDDKLYYAGLIEIDGYYYYVNSSCKVITNCTYWISKTNGLMAEKAYTFDAQGRMVIGDHPDVKTGLYDEDGKTYYYVEGVKTYAGLIEIDGYWYYVKSDCSIVKDGIFWITKTNDVVKQGRYTFDAEGRMVP